MFEVEGGDVGPRQRSQSSGNAETIRSYGLP
jgi:hypothetical protein